MTTSKKNNQIRRYDFRWIIGLLVLVYFIGTSGWFVKTIVPPRAGKAFNANIKADDIVSARFSQVVVKNLSLTQWTINRLLQWGVLQPNIV
jgi:hypothetical protein